MLCFTAPVSVIFKLIAKICTMPKLKNSTALQIQWNSWQSRFHNLFKQETWFVHWKKVLSIFIRKMEPASQFAPSKHSGDERFLVAFPLILLTKRKEVKVNIFISIRDFISDFFIIFQKALDNGRIYYKFFPKISI